MKITAGNIACEFKEKVLESDIRTIVKACLDERELGIGGGKVMEERGRNSNRNGLSIDICDTCAQNRRLPSSVKLAT